jgi:hypothetical protein
MMLMNKMQTLFVSRLLVSYIRVALIMYNFIADEIIIAGIRILKMYCSISQLYEESFVK